MTDARPHNASSAEPHSAISAKARHQSKIRRSAGDRLAIIVGAALAFLLLGFFGWRMIGTLERDRALVPVAEPTPTPPPRR